MATKKSSKASEKKRATSHTPLPQRIYRVEDNKVLGGVAGGIGEYFGFDPTIVRVLFVFLSIFGGSGIILYLVLWVIMPAKSDVDSNSSDAIRTNIEDMKRQAKGAADSFSTRSDGENRSFWAVILVVVGILFLISNYGIFDINIGRLWPLLLILLGLLILRRK